MRTKLAQALAGNPAVSTVLVGRNRSGNWVAREQSGAFGGLFVNRAQALKYALWENGRHLEAIIEVAHEIELDIPAHPQRACRACEVQYVGASDVGRVADVCSRRADRHDHDHMPAESSTCPRQR